MKYALEDNRNVDYRDIVISQPWVESALFLVERLDIFLKRKNNLQTSDSKTSENKICVPVYGFPLDQPDQVEAWLRAIPNRKSKDEITVHPGICRLHWPDTFKTRRKNRHVLPAEPPSVFAGLHIPPSCIPTPPPKPRRSVLSSNTARNPDIDQLLDHLLQTAVPIHQVSS